MRCERKQRTERGHGRNSIFRASSFARCAFATDDRTVPCPCTADALVVRVIVRAVIVPFAGFTLPFAAFAALTTAIVRSVCVLFRGARVFDASVVCCVACVGTDAVREMRSRSPLFRKGLGRFSSSDISYSGDVREMVVVTVEVEEVLEGGRDFGLDRDGGADAGGETRVCDDEDVRCGCVDDEGAEALVLGLGSSRGRELDERIDGRRSRVGLTTGLGVLSMSFSSSSSSSSSDADTEVGGM